MAPVSESPSKLTFTKKVHSGKLESGSAFNWQCITCSCLKQLQVVYIGAVDVLGAMTVLKWTINCSTCMDESHYIIYE